MIRNFSHKGFGKSCDAFGDKIFDSTKVDNEIHLSRREPVLAQESINFWPHPGSPWVG